MPDGTIDEAHIQRIVAADPIWATRGRAIQAYAVLEQRLRDLFAAISGMEGAAAAVVFFKITSKRTIREIIEKLIRQKYGSTYNLFWNSYIRCLNVIDNQRNEVAHWIVQQRVEVKGGKAPKIEVTLVPPNLWDASPTTPSHTTESLMEFVAKCEVYSNLCLRFWVEVARHRGEVEQPWRDIFLRPIVYPLPADHPLYRSSQKR